jgi:hypothetical protein
MVFKMPSLKVSLAGIFVMEQHALKNVDNCLNTYIYSYLVVKVLIYI